jgi:predicted DNA-binding protein YlxM (UPF0122 family)
MNSISNKCVITGDIKGSRAFSAADWRIIQSRIRKALVDINKSHSSAILRGFTITLDDEFQGVLNTPEDSYDISVHLQDIMPVEFRCGIGIGKIEVLSSKITEMRGESFFRSREALELAKKSGYPVIVKSSDAENNLMDDTLNTILGFINTIQSMWSNRQMEVVKFCRSHKDSTYSDLARELNVSKQSISKVLNAAHWKAVQNGEQSVRRLLKELKTTSK